MGGLGSSAIALRGNGRRRPMDIDLAELALIWRGDRANGSLERLSATSASISGTSGSPLRPGCYAAALLTTLLLSDSPLLENEHRVLLESNHAVVQGLQSRHHFQVMDGP